MKELRRLIVPRDRKIDTEELRRMLEESPPIFVNEDEWMEGMTINGYYKAAKRTMNPDLTWEQLRNHALHGIASECGEIHGLYQKTYQGHEITKERVIDEIGDLCWFIMELCYAEQIDPEEVLEYNVDKLVKRYPDGFSTERSVNRK